MRTDLRFIFLKCKSSRKTAEDDSSGEEDTEKERNGVDFKKVKDSIHNKEKVLK